MDKCQHIWKHYVGFNHEDWYCEKCKEKTLTEPVVMDETTCSTPQTLPTHSTGIVYDSSDALNYAMSNWYYPGNIKVFVDEIEAAAKENDKFLKKLKDSSLDYKRKLLGKFIKD
jgi:hypothetical protein